VLGLLLACLFSRPIMGHNRFWAIENVYASANGGQYDFVIEQKSDAHPEFHNFAWRVPIISWLSTRFIDVSRPIGLSGGFRLHIHGPTFAFTAACVRLWQLVDHTSSHRLLGYLQFS
jgi:hypothetical protein